MCNNVLILQISILAMKNLATGQAQAVPIFPPGTQERSNTGSKWENKAINTYYYVFLHIIDRRNFCNEKLYVPAV